MKNQLKKSLSLFMAVLMVLSCWVWVAPQKAEAADQNDGYYYLEVYGVFADYVDTAHGGASSTWTVSYKTNNGTGSDGSQNLSYVYNVYDSSQHGKTIVLASGWVPGFPTGIKNTATASTGYTSGSTTAYDGFRYEGIIIRIKNHTSGGYQILRDQGDKYTSPENSTRTYTWDASWDLDTCRPEITADNFTLSAFNPTEVTIPLISSDSNTTVTASASASIYDQYGTKWVTAPDFIVGKSALDTEDICGEEKGITLSTDASGMIATVTIDKNLQIEQTSSSDKQDFYLIATVKKHDGSALTKSTALSVKYPKYTVSVNGAGSITGLNYTLGIKGGTTTSAEWKVSGYYSASLGNVPDGTASATGYDFKGLWSVKQPTSGKASYNAYESEFATPISSEKFEEYKSAGGTVDGSFITYNNKLYYNAGTEWSPAKQMITGDESYYAWWLSKDINVKFYDIDGKFLGSFAVKYGQTQNDIEWPDPSVGYVSGAYTYSTFTGIWEHTDGTEIDQSDCTFTKDLILTPTYKDITFDDKYTVTFVDQDNGGALTGSDDYAYRTNLGEIGKIPADREVPTAINKDLQYSYTFEGWSAQEPSSGYYHILLEDGDFNEDGTAIGINSDWIVRSDVTYYPVYRRHLRTYAVIFWFRNSTGVEVSRRVNLKYGEILIPPTEDVPLAYATNGYGYEFTTWEYAKTISQTVALGYSESLVFTKENINITLGAVEDGVNVDPVDITAAYKYLGGVDYNVTFKYKNDKGEDEEDIASVKHGSLIEEETVGSLAPAAEYDDGEALVHFTKTWKFVSGAGELNGSVIAEGSEIGTDDLKNFSPTSHVVFEAVYGNPEPFYTVTYVDGAKTFSERVLKGKNLPVWTIKQTNNNETPDNPDDDFEEDVEYLPEMADSAQGEYEFLGWYDEQQTDKDYAVTNGTKYEATSNVTSNLTLYPQFKFKPFTYTIKFMDYEGKNVLAEGEFVYGADLTALISEAEEKAGEREGDNTYTYNFLGWDKAVPTFCEGHDMTFTAQYKPVYRYYNVKWYNSVLDGENWVADKSTKTEDDVTVETALLAITKHTYNSKLNAPSVKATCTVTPPAGQSYVFAGWYYNDADGNSQPYVRGMVITAEMEFYAKYTLSAKIYTVTTDIKGETEEYKVADGEKATVIPEPNAGYVDADKHEKFAGWVTKDADGNEAEFKINEAPITGDITIYAKFTESSHEFNNEELVESPTYYAKGEKKTWCSCDAKQTEKTVEIPMLTDTVAPTGTIYLGTQGSWSSTDDVGAAATDGDEVKYFANADTDLILTINDTGDVNTLYNPSGLGKGISVIQGFISKGVYSQDNTDVEMSEVIKIFEDTTEDLNNVANYVVKLGEYGGLEEGATYVAYYFVRDKAGNVLNTKVRTAKFIYDNTAPVFTVEGDSNAETVNGTPTYCKKATVTGVEAGATLTVNGKSVELTTSAAGTGTYTITEAGNYLVTVTDKAGNKTSKKFQLIADHNYDVKEVLSTCTEDGYKTEICIVCGYQKSKVEYKSSGHDWTISHVPATCTENGYTYKHCEVCGEEEKIYDVDGELIDPAHDHIYDKDGDEIIYTVVTKPTCKTKGKEIATCKACGETITREIAIDENAHSWGATKTLKPTCTETGKTYHTCKLCYTSKDIDVIAATGHIETQWVVTEAATCGEAGVETLQCKKCKAYVDGDDEDTEIDTREIPATGRHILAVSEDPAKTFEATADKEGQITRYCTQCGQEWTEKVDKIKKYIVKFVDEDGKTVLDTIEDVVSGTTITKGAVTEPTKANSGDGKYKYSFAGWVKLVTNEDGTTSDGDAVALPIDVTEDITLKATYAQSTIIYTHQFKVPNTWIQTLDTTNSYDLFATMMGAMGDSRVPVSNPTFKHYDEKEDARLKLLYTFEFKYWANEKGEKVEDFTIAGDATFYAVFEAKAIEYQVIYYNGADYVWDTKVEGGMPVTFGGTEPTKDPDGDYHYAFNTWFTDEDCEEGTEYVVKYDETTGELEKGAITALTRLYAGFTATKHKWEKDPYSEANKAATCDDPAEVAYKCAECSATKVDIEGEKLGHTEAYKTETVDDITYSVVYCSVCKKELRRTQTSVTVKFNNHNGVRLETKNLNIGDAITYSGKTPEKATDAQFTYEFIGWYVEGDENKALVTLEAATADVTYVAEFKAITRVFRVTYVDAKNNTLQTTEGIAYGSAIPAFTGTKPTKEYDDIYHYTFDKWSVAEDAVVTSDLVIQPVFNRIKHNYVDIGTVEATCTEKGGTKKKCSGCASNYIAEGTVPALGHDFVQINRVEPDYDKQIDGYIEYACSRCDVTDKKVLSAALIEIKVVVKDTNGVAREGIRVDLYVLNTETRVDSKNTDANGEAKFYVKPGDYEARVDGKKTYLSVDKDGTVEGNGKVEVEPEVKAPDCSCNCHKTSFWGILFRLFHKFIKLFTGRIICCDNPDAKYYK